MKLDVKVDLRGVMERLDLLPAQVNAATAAALNDTANAVRTNAVKTIAKETGLKQADIRTRMWIKRATRNGLIAEVGALPSATNLGRYPKARPQQNRIGVTVTAWGKRQSYKGAFVLGGSKAQDVTPVLRRDAGSKRVTAKVYGPSVRNSFKRMDQQHYRVVEQKFKPYFERRLRAALMRNGIDLTGVGNVLE